MSNPLQAAQAVLDAAHTSLASDQQNLLSIFSTIKPLKKAHTADMSIETLVFQPQRFLLKRDVLFPVATPDRSFSKQALFDAYTQQVQQLTSTGALRLEQQLALLYDYGWALPSSEPAVSLYDKLRTEAAVKAAQAASDSQVLLLGGDISGIQQFIYTIAPDSAAKSLRARSLYLQLLTDAIAHFLRRKANMPLTNLIYSGGGRFFLLLPSGVEQQIEAWRKELGTFLLATHQGEIYVALGWHSFAADQPKTDFKAIWRSVNESIAEDKQRRFASLDQSILQEVVFAPRGAGGGADDACAVCHVLIRAAELETSSDVEAEDGSAKRVCKLCESLIRLGRDLPRAEILDQREVEPNLHQFKLPRDGTQQRHSYEQVLKALGLQVFLKQDERVTPHKGQRIALLTAHAIAKLDTYRQLYPDSVIQIRPMVNEVARESGGIIEFDKLTNASTGISRLGVLRMDLDDLGDIFAFALRENSLARTSALSSALSRFFEGWVGVLCQEINNEQKTKHSLQGVYSVYSGGDDLFIAGSWNLMPRLATLISSDLQQYTGNPHIHVSGGISLHSAKYPLYQAARESEHALDAAKDLEGKNGFGFLDQAVRWEYLGSCTDELNLEAAERDVPAPRIWALVNTLARYTSADTAEATDKLPRATLQVLQELYVQYALGPRRRNKADHEQLVYGPWIWRGEYQLIRMRERARKDSRARALLHILYTHFKAHLDQTTPHTGQRMIERYGLAARWVQLLVRKEDRNGDNE